MASEETIETRLISGTGLLRIPNDKQDRRLYTLFAQVIRPPRSPYLNMKSNPPEGFYAKITCINNSFVYKIFSHDFETQAWEFIPDISGQTLIAIKCAYDGLLTTFQNLGYALQTPPITATNTISTYKNLKLPFTEFRIKCYANTAIQFTLKAIPFDSCESSKQPPQDTPSSPAITAQVPFDTPLDISPPYTNDSITDKADIDDQFVPPPLGENCQVGTLRFTYTYTQPGSPEQTAEAATACYGPVSRDFRVKAGIGGVLETQHRGNPFIEGCSTYTYRDILSIGATRTITGWSNIRFPA